MGKLDRERDPLEELDRDAVRFGPDRVTGYSTAVIEQTVEQLTVDLQRILYSPRSQPSSNPPRQ